MKEILECVDNFLEPLVLALTDLSLRVSISIFVFLLLWAIEIESILILKKNNIFVNSLLSAIIQDSGTRERNNV